MIIFDLDGTLRDPAHRKHFIDGPDKDWSAFYMACDGDAPIRYMLENVVHFTEMGKTIEIWSGCAEMAREITERWLGEHGIEIEGSSAPVNPGYFDGRTGKVRALLMRSDYDYTPDVALKQLWLKEKGLFAPPEPIELVLDDRKKVVDMWRRNGIPCVQVAEGNF